MITNFSTSSVRTGIKRKRFWDQSAVANSFFSIATTTVGSGGASNIEFTNIPQTYTHLQIRGILRDNATGYTFNNCITQFNSDTGSNYSYHALRGTGAAADSFNGTSQTSMLLNQNAGVNATSGNFAPVIMDIFDYRDTNKFKTVRSIFGFTNVDTNTRAIIFSGNWRSTSAITSIKLTPANSGSFVQYSSLALYGVLA